MTIHNKFESYDDFMSGKIYIIKILVYACQNENTIKLAVCLEILIKLFVTLSKNFGGKVTEPYKLGGS